MRAAGEAGRLQAVRPETRTVVWCSQVRVSGLTA